MCGKLLCYFTEQNLLIFILFYFIKTEQSLFLIEIIHVVVDNFNSSS